MAHNPQRPLVIALVIIGILLALILLVVGLQGAANTTNGDQINNNDNTTIEHDESRVPSGDERDEFTQNDIDIAVQQLFELTANAQVTVNNEVNAEVSVNITPPPLTATPPPTPIPSIIGYWRYGISNDFHFQPGGIVEFPTLTQRYTGTYTYDGTFLTIYYEHRYQGPMTIRFRVMELTHNRLVVVNLDNDSPTVYTRIY